MRAKLIQAALLTLVFHLWMSLNATPNSAPSATLPQLTSFLNTASASR